MATEFRELLETNFTNLTSKRSSVSSESDSAALNSLTHRGI